MFRKSSWRYPSGLMNNFTIVSSRRFRSNRDRRCLGTYVQPMFCAYARMRAGVRLLTRVAALEGARMKPVVRVNWHWCRADGDAALGLAAARDAAWAPAHTGAHACRGAPARRG